MCPSACPCRYRYHAPADSCNSVLEPRSLYCQALATQQRRSGTHRTRRNMVLRLQSNLEKWTHWDLNPGPSACEADVIPLHHVPICIGRSMDNRWIAFLRKWPAFAKCSLVVACTVHCMLQDGSLTPSAMDQIRMQIKNKPPLGMEPRTFSLQD